MSYRKNELTQYLRKRENASKTIQYDGINEVLPAWSQWFEERGYAIKRFCNDETNEEWTDKNKYLVLFNRKTKEIKALRTYGQHYLESSDFFSVTDWVPLFTNEPPKNEEQLNARIQKIEGLLDELDAQVKETENPIVLLDDMNGNDYLAYAVNENKKMFVHNFKTYNSSDFLISEYDAKATDKIEENDRYNVIVYSKELIEELGLHLYPDHWGFITPGSLWTPREPKKHSGRDYGQYNDLYDRTLALINKLRTEPNNESELNWKLENRLQRFENLVELNAPKVTIADEAWLIKKALQE